VNIDLSKTGRIGADHARRFDAVAGQARYFYNDLVSDLAKGHENDLDWWVSGIASRNTYVCSLFQEFCQVLFVKELLCNEEIKGVVVESRAVKKCLVSICKKKGREIPIKVREGFFSFFAILLNAVLDFGKDIVRQLYRTWLSKYRFPSVGRYYPEQCTLVELFVLDNSFDKGDFNDRYYCDFGGFLTDEEKKPLVYLPTLSVRLKNLARIIKEIRSDKRIFIIQEELLKWNDYLYAWLYPFRYLCFYPKKVSRNGVDMTPLLRRAWWRHLFSSRSVEALLKYRFLKRLSEEKITVRLIVDWYENQDMDKAANLAYRHYFPNSMVIGYQGFDTQKYWLCAYPSEKEYTSGIVPPIVAVCGESLVEERKRFCRQLKIEVAPAFRNQGVWQESRSQEIPTKGCVMAVLPLETENAKEIIEIVKDTAVLLAGKTVRFFIKPHPAARMKSIYGEFLSPALEIIEGDIKQYWDHIDVVVGNTSSVLLEAVARGKPVIVIGNRRGITNNPIPEQLDEDIWRLVFTSGELAETVEYYLSLSFEVKKRFATIGEKIRAQYFAPVTRADVIKLLRLDQLCHLMPEKQCGTCQ